MKIASLKVSVWCCEWMSTNCAPISFSCDKFTGVSFTKALDVPVLLISLLIIEGVWLSKSLFAKNAVNQSPSVSNCASTIHFFDAFCSTEVSARLPVSNPSASNNIYFPAPVSPVITVIPLCKSIFNLLIKA